VLLEEENLEFAAISTLAHFRSLLLTYSLTCEVVTAGVFESGEK